MTIHIARHSEKELRLIFKYDDAYIHKIKMINRRRWEPEIKAWIVPYDEATIDYLCSNFAKRELNFELGLRPIIDEARSEQLKTIENYYLKLLKDKLVLGGYSRLTRDAYLGHVAKLIRYYEKNPDQLSDNDINGYLLHLLSDKESSHSYVNQAISAIKFLYTDIIKNQAIEINITRPKKEKKLPEILSQTEVLAIFNAIENIKHKSILFLIYSAGLRIGEVVRLKPADIDSSRMLIHVTQAKGRKDRYTILSEAALEQLREYVKKYHPTTWLFPGTDIDEHITERTVQRIFEKAKQQVQIKKKVSVHSLRHAFATHLLEGGVDLRYIQELLGHQSSRTTEIYTHVTQKSINNITSPLDKIIAKTKY